MSGSRLSSHYAKVWKWLPVVVALAGFLALFRVEVQLVWHLISAYCWILFQFLAFHVQPTLPITSETARACAVLGLNLIVFVFGWLLVLLWVAQFTLPVRSHSERWKAFSRLLLYTIAKDLHGPAIFVKEGKPKADENELNNLHAGVAFVDLNSAIVLEQQLETNDSVKQEVRFESQTGETIKRKSSKMDFWKMFPNYFMKAHSKTKITIVKTFGPGVTFTGSGEKIVGWADLRKQSRTRKDVQASTRDGIEIITNISVGFSLGQEEEILQVAKVNSEWRIIQTSPASAADAGNNPYLQSRNLVIKLLPDSLSDDDAAEVEGIFSRKGFIKLESSLQAGGQKSGHVSEFVFDEGRVFAAVYSRARNAKNGMLGEWTDLPVYAAAEVFRGLLAHETYDELYLPEEPKKFPLIEFKRKFGRAVQNMGILGYQIVVRKDDLPLEDGQIYSEDELIFSKPMRFQSPAVLRDRGIKVLFASFSDLVPSNEFVRAQLFENWRAHWQSETQKSLADHELTAARIHNRERSRTQQDMIYSLSRIFRDNKYTDEAIAIRLYQALEVAATHPTTQRLLPADTVQMLSNLRRWLLPDGKHTGDDNNGDT
jgi:hypothetical protein